jgi:uncharacterized protein (DUF2252 family)
MLYRWLMKHDDEVARGRALRATVPRSSHAFQLPGAREPLGILETQNADRLAHLVPLRMERMVSSPFAFYRGSAALMAADLAAQPTTGLMVTSCGDAHISNFGFFASPQRTLVFDLNDFDEGATGPWEWDIKRVVASVIIGARDVGFTEDETLTAGLAAATSYRVRIAELMDLTVMERYYTVLDAESIRENALEPGKALLDRIFTKARKRTSEQVVAKMTTVTTEGARIFAEDPLLTRVPDENRGDIERLLAEYRQTVSADIALVLSQHELTDVALRVVGVGSVGTRCYVLLLTGPNGGSLVLQVKEAGRSVTSEWGGIEQGLEADHGGRRVVDNQRIMQAVSDPFLGYLSFGGRDYYVRQFRDMKGSIELSTLTVPQFGVYAAGCARVLARAHAQSPVAPAIHGYLGGSDVFDRAVVEWAVNYADQSLEDFHAVKAAYSSV